MRTLIAALTVLTYGPEPRTVQCAQCGFHYQEPYGHACPPRR